MGVHVFSDEGEEVGDRKEEDRCTRDLLEVSVDKQCFISLEETSTKVQFLEKELISSKIC